MLIRHLAGTASKALNARLAPALLAGAMLAGALAGCSHAGSMTTDGTGAGAVGSGISSGPAAAPSAAPSAARKNGAVPQDAAAFCSFISGVSQVATKATSQKQGLQLLSTIVPRLQVQSVTAPAPVAADFAIVAAAAKQALTEADLAPLATNQVATAGTALTAYCHARS
jgi:hypothetical protein